MVAFNDASACKKFQGVFLGLRCPPMSGCWGLLLGLGGGRGLRIFWNDWRPVRDAVDALGLRPGDRVRISYRAAWSWSVRREEG